MVLVLAACAAFLPDAAAGTSGKWCQGSETWQSARRSDGRLPVRVKARIAGVSYSKSSTGRPTFIDLGHAFPKQARLTLVIWGRDRLNFPRAPERMFRRGQLVCAQGFVSWYRGVAQIEVALWDAEGRLLSF